MRTIKAKVNLVPVKEFTKEELAEHDKQIRADTIRDFIQVFTRQTKLRQMTKQECIEKMCQIAIEIKERNNG